MKTKTQQNVLAFVILILLAGLYNKSNAQVLAIKAKVTYEGESTFEKFRVKLLNMQTNDVIEVNDFKTFNLNLAYNQMYVIIVSKEGYQSKSIYVDTKCNITKDTKYNIIVDLKTNEFDKDLPLQAGGIFYDKHKNSFDFYLN